MASVVRSAGTPTRRLPMVRHNDHTMTSPEPAPASGATGTVAPDEADEPGWTAQFRGLPRWVRIMAYVTTGVVLLLVPLSTSATG